jgi:ammonia channel protein AmtB
MLAGAGLLMWTSLDVLVFGKPSVIGAVQGMITGLVVITPAAGKGSFAAEFHSCLKKKTLCSRTNNTLEC